MRKLLFGLALIGAPLGTAHATPISISTFGTTYTQNFDGLANNPGFTVSSATDGTTATTIAKSNGTDAASLQGFEFDESGGSRADGAYLANDGSAGTGDSYSYGTTTTSEDRAFGVQTTNALGTGIGANATNPGTAFGLVFTNNTGKTIDSLTLSYRGEQYRFGGTTTGNPDRIDFQIDRDGDSIIGTNFTNINALDFPSPNRNTVGMLDGNAEGNYTYLTGVYAPTGGIAAGNSFVVRFVPVDQSGTDDGLAIDDFTMTANSETAPVPEPSTFALFAVGMLGMGFMLRRRKAGDNGEMDVATLPC